MPKVCGQTLLQLRQPMHENSSTKACGRAAKALEGTAPAQCSPQRSPCPTSLHLRRALNAALALPCKPRRQLCRQQCKSHTALQSCLQTATCARRRTALQACLQHPTVMPQLSVGSPASCLLRGQAAHVVPLIRRVHKGVHGAVREARQRVVGGALLRVQQRLCAGPRGASGADRPARGAPRRVHASSRAYLLNKRGCSLQCKMQYHKASGPHLHDVVQEHAHGGGGFLVLLAAGDRKVGVAAAHRVAVRLLYLPLAGGGCLPGRRHVISCQLLVI